MGRYKLSELAIGKLEYGSGAAATLYDGNIRYVRITDIDEGGHLGNDIVSPNTIDKKYILNEGDVLFARTGATVGKTYLYHESDGQCIYAGFLIRVVPNKELIRPSYLYYYTKSPQYKKFVISSMKVVAQPNINAKQYGDLEFEVPNLQVQDKIVEKLSLIESIIAKRTEELKRLDELIKARFVEMFDDIKDICDVGYYIKSLTAGKSLAGEAECENKVLKTGAASFDYFDASQIKNLPLDYEPQAEHLVKAGDIIISRMNTAELTGAAAYVWDIQENVYLPDRLWKANLNDECNPIFVWQMLIQPSTKEQIRRECSGTSGSMKNISKPGMLAIKVKKVPFELQNQFAEFVKQVDKSKVAVQKSLDETQKLFDSLMQEYFG